METVLSDCILVSRSLCMCECVCCLLPLFSVNQCLCGGGDDGMRGRGVGSSLAMLVGRHGTLTGNKQRRHRENESKVMHHGSFPKLSSCRRRSFVSGVGDFSSSLHLLPSFYPSTFLCLPPCDSFLCLNLDSILTSFSSSR